MKCPLCKSRKHVELDLHADGFSQDVRECGDCGAVWTFSGEVRKIIKPSTSAVIKERLSLQKKFSTDFVCPTCHCMLSYETDLDAFQFHEELYECTVCGTVCSSAHGQLEVVMDSQKGSFLDSTGDLVEADDYNMM